MKHTENSQPTETAPHAFWDGFIPEAEAADFLCQSVRTIQKWRVTGAELDSTVAESLVGTAIENIRAQP
tara:strand:+ start:25158 stop:25364 length:207 start_codon:yes stop_codon:yes gene_type:complete